MMKKGMKLAVAFLAKNRGVVRGCCMAALLLGAGSALADGATPTGVLDTFDVATAGTAIRGIVITVLGIIGTVYGALMGFVFLRWVYRKINGSLAK